MTLFPIRCPYCGSYNLEWLSEQELRCLDCGAIFTYLGVDRRSFHQNEGAGEGEAADDGSN